MKNYFFVIFSLVFLVSACCEKEEQEHMVDLKAEDITFSVTGIDPQMQDFGGEVVVTGIVKNIGIDTYESNPGQQSVQLYELRGWDAELVATTPFENVNPGGTIRVDYTRSWNISSPAEGEFPPLYKVIISYDPDIRIDGNDKNDDSDNSNDEHSESSSQVNDMFF